jgi:putative ABC transport system ATP-binding protein
MRNPAWPIRTMLLQIRNLSHRIGDRRILELPAFDVAAGEHSLVLGPSGSGKSTLINIVAGLVRPTAGEVRVNGVDVTSLAPAAQDTVRRMTLGIVFQAFRLVSALTVRQNLGLAQRIALGAIDRFEIDALIERVGLAHRRDALPRHLSHGEAQRAAIARALCARPALIVADEPTSALDDANAAAIVELLMENAEQSGSTLLIATHDTRIRAQFTRVLDLGGTRAAA